MKKLKRGIYSLMAIFFIAYAGLWVFKHYNFNSDYTVGEKIDAIHGVAIYYNGGVGHVLERNTAPDGYNIGLKYQCVEFIKRYYYQHLNHKMPDSYGNAKDFFDAKLKDGAYNSQRNLRQYTNASQAKPQVGDLLVYKGTLFNKYGHVAIVSQVDDTEIEIVQQNPGPFRSSRERYALSFEEKKWTIKHPNILGWLRKE